MFKQNISFEVWGGSKGKYRLRDSSGEAIENTPEETCKRVAKALADIELPEYRDEYYKKFVDIIGTKFSGGGRIMANVGTLDYKKEVSPINCTVMRQIPDSMEGIMEVAKESALTLKAGCGVGYDFSTIRPKGAHVFGAGSETSGIISFMKIFDAICATVMSGGARRGAQMACLDISSPEIEDFITAKRQDGILRFFNCSVLVTDAFMKAVENNENWDLWFWEKDNDLSINNIDVKKIKIIKQSDIPYNYPSFNFFTFAKDHNEVVFKNTTANTVFVKKIYKTVKASYIFDLIMKSTYDFAEPGFIIIDRINIENNLYFCEIIRATNPCGEQPLSPLSSCLLGSMILPAYVNDAFDKKASFDFKLLYEDVLIASRALDNVVEINNLPLKAMQEQIKLKRRHGLGITGLGSTLNMIGLKYGSEKSLIFADKIAFTIAEASLRANILLAKEKGCAPIFLSKEAKKLVIKSKYLERLLNALDDKDQLIKDIIKYGLRYSHATTIAPNGTLSLTWGNNCSNGIEPVFADEYLRNIREPGKKTKKQESVMDYAFFLWKEKFNNKPVPDYWSTTEVLNVSDHIKIQAAMQKWCDSSISKTINVPFNYPFEDFKRVYMDGWKAGLKGITTFRFNPDAFSGVLVQKSDLDKTNYLFVDEDGKEFNLKGSDQVEYDGETHNVANLFDALKEGLYGNM